MQWNKEFIFEDERDFVMCHASTILELPGGDRLAAWFGGTHEGAGDTAIWCARRTQDGWSKPVNLTGEQDLPHFNPVLFRGENGVIRLVYKTGWNTGNWITMVKLSTNDGRSWTNAEQLVRGDRSGGRGPVKNKPIMTSDGAALLAPASLEVREGNWDAFVDVSFDGGETWNQSALVPLNRKALKSRGVIQPTLWESEPGHIHMLLRSTEGFVFRSDSTDAGFTWSTGYPISVPNNNSGFDLTRMPNGDLIMVYNPVQEDWGARTPLVLDVSSDNGESWRRLHVLEDTAGEFSYPAIVSHGNRVHVTYTWKRERVAYVYFDYE